MRQVLLYSILLILGLILAQFLPWWIPAATLEQYNLAIKLGTMACLSFIMIHVGWEFELDKNNLRQYGWDYIVAATAAGFPWLFCAAYFVLVMAPQPMWTSWPLWKEALLEGRFAAPTSAGILFSMLAAAGLTATWLFRKARILAIFDDLDTVLFMIPLKMLMVGPRWQLGGIVLFMLGLLILAWKYLHTWRLPTAWPWVIAYSVIIVLVSEVIYVGSKVMDDTVPIHLEVLLPAFVLGCLMRRPGQDHAHATDHHELPPNERRVATIISAGFMVLVGLSMPPILVQANNDVTPPLQTTAHADEVYPSAQKYPGIDPQIVAEKERFPGWGMIALHVLAVTVLSNLGKMFPAFCYRREAPWRHRLAVAVGMFPRGEVGAGVLIVSLAYGISGPALTVAMLSLALNLVCTGLFILIVKRLLAHPDNRQPDNPQTTAL